MLQLIYISAATEEFSDDDLKQLLVKARANNSKLDITGMLIYHEGTFLQILEGEPENVRQLYKKIEKDWRHRKVRLLLKAETDTPSFREWRMGFYQSPASTEKMPAGFFDFFNSNGILGAKKGDQAIDVLRQFREGKWRQEVAWRDQGSNDAA